MAVKAMRALPIAALLAGALLTAGGCSNEKVSFVRNVGGGDSTPTMLTTDVSTFVSDSGYTRYHIQSRIWAMYDEAEVPFWKFPETLTMHQFDRDLNVTANMRCDSATYFSQKRLWRLDGDVRMVNTAGDSFASPQVFWDQVKREVYSDSFVHIVRSDRIIEGYGFTSNEQMTEYTVHRPTGIFPVTRADADTQPADTASTDTIADPGRRRPRRL